jgi:hypothetical protein
VYFPPFLVYFINKNLATLINMSTYEQRKAINRELFSNWATNITKPLSNARISIVKPFCFVGQKVKIILKSFNQTKKSLNQVIGIHPKPDIRTVSFCWKIFYSLCFQFWKQMSGWVSRRRFVVTRAKKNCCSLTLELLFNFNYSADAFIADDYISYRNYYSFCCIRQKHNILYAQLVHNSNFILQNCIRYNYYLHVLRKSQLNSVKIK